MLPYTERRSVKGCSLVRRRACGWCRCRKVSEAGSQQLLLDTQAIKALLLDFPSAGMMPFYTHRRSILRLAPQFLNVLFDPDLRERLCLQYSLIPRLQLASEQPDSGWMHEHKHMRAYTGKPGEAVHASFSGYVAREMGRAEALLKVVGSRPENLVDNLFTLMPSGSPADFQRILELKARPPAAHGIGLGLLVVAGGSDCSQHVAWTRLPCRCRVYAVRVQLL